MEQPPAGIPDKPTLSPREVAALLGVGKNQVYSAVKDGRIPNVGLSRTIRIPTAWVRSILTNWGNS